MKNKQYIKVPKISNQKVRQKYYTPESITHPAKADIPMMHWILKKFIQEGDIVLDPMCGIGTTMIEGMRLFPNSLFIGVELENKFVKMVRANIRKTEKIAKKDMFLKIGKAVCVQGDARDLSKIMKEKVSKIITSPPFQEADIQRPGNQKSRANYNYGSKLKYTPKNPNNIANLAERKYGSVNKIISSPPFGQAQSGGGIAKKGYDGPKHTPTDMMGKRSYMPENIGGKKNIGNLPYGQADKIITSPPYSEIRMDGGGKNRAGMKPYTDEPADTWRTQREQKNIGNLPHGKIDKIVSSPPYLKDVEPHTEMRPGAKRETTRGYVDKVISSPPYEEGLGHGGKRRTKVLSRSKGIWAQGRDSYSKSKTNIGSLIGKTYLGEMLKVYRECFKILKPGGLMILITKDFIRNKKRVRLGEDTIKLCQAAGFVFKEIYHRKIEHPSFWRTLYHQKHPEVEKIDSEDIPIFEKTPSPSAG